MQPIIRFLKKYFVDKPLIGWNILAFFGMSAVHWSLGPLLLVLSLYLHAKRQNTAYQEKLQEEAKSYLEEVITNRAVPVIQPSIFLEDGEHAFYEESTKLYETKSVRRSTGTGGGVRVAKGIYVGGYSGSSESHKVWRNLDQGDLILTSQRLVFMGSKENRTVPLKGISSVEKYKDGIEVSLSTRAKGMIFSVKNPHLWDALIRILRSVKDPLHLEPLEAGAGRPISISNERAMR